MWDNQIETVLSAIIEDQIYCPVCGKKTFQIGEEREILCTETGWVLGLDISHACTECSTYTVKLIAGGEDAWD